MDKSTKVDKVGTHSSFVKAKLIHNMKDNDTLLLSLRDHEHP